MRREPEESRPCARVSRRVARVVKVVQPGGIPESLGEGVGVDLELGDELVLIGGDGGEDCLGKDEGVVQLLVNVGDGWATLAADHKVDARLVAVHGVQNNLEKRKETHLTNFEWDLWEIESGAIDVLGVVVGVRIHRVGLFPFLLL